MLLDISAPSFSIPCIDEPAFIHQADIDWLTEPATSLAGAAQLCQRLATVLNADSFHLFFLISHGETCRLVPVSDSDAPAVSDMSKALSARTADGFARAASDAAQPLWWSSQNGNFPAQDAAAWMVKVEAPAPGTSGIAFPVAIERGRNGLIVFCGPDMTVDESRLCEAHARCFSIFESVVRHRAPDYEKLPSISRRELECLRLTADGLTSDDIASSLGLSVHTANQYLTNSTHKLNAVNRIHAVAKALRCGLID